MAFYAFKPNPYSSHAVILQSIREERRGKSILDVGASTGYLAERLAQEGYEVTAVEKDPAVARDLEQAGFRVLIADVEDPSFHLSEAFDIVILGDVLEHLVDPWAALRRFVSVLKDDGLMIISLPNSVSLPVRLMVLLGHFDYMEKGPLDKTHLRFFTLTTTKKLVTEGTGLTITKMRVTSLLSFISSRHPLFRAANDASYLLALLWKRMFAYQFVILAQKREREH